MTEEKESKPIKKRGGRQPGAGRPKGSTNKITGQSILDTIAQYDEPFEIGLAKDYHRVRLGNDQHLIMKYQQMILNKVVADKADVDITSNGQTIQITLTPKETGEYDKKD